MSESRQQRVLRLVSFDASKFNGNWYSLQVEGRASWDWGNNLGDPLMRKCLMIRRNSDGELQIDKWIYQSNRAMDAKTPFSARWKIMSPRFSELFEMVVWPYV